MKKVKIKVSGINCMGCVGKIKKGIESLDQESSVNVDIPSQSISIEFHAEKMKISDIKEKIEMAGFPIQSVEIE